MTIHQQVVEHQSVEHTDWVFSVEDFGRSDAVLLLLVLFLIVFAIRWLRRRGRARS